MRQEGKWLSENKPVQPTIMKFVYTTVYSKVHSIVYKTVYRIVFRQLWGRQKG